MKEQSQSLLTVQDVIKILAIKESHLRDLIFKKEIPFIKVGRLVRFDRRELALWIDDNSNKRSL